MSNSALLRIFSCLLFPQLLKLAFCFGNYDITHPGLFWLKSSFSQQTKVESFPPCTMLSGQLPQCSCQHFRLPRGPSSSPALDGAMVSLLLADCRLLPEKVLRLHAAGALLQPAVPPQLGQVRPLSTPFTYPSLVPWIILCNFSGLVFFLEDLNPIRPLNFNLIYLSFILLSSLKERCILSQKFSDVSSRCPLAVFFKK